MEKQRNLLESLAEKLHCTYLSDLRSTHYDTAISSELKKIEEHEYSLQEWNDAIQYFLQNAERFDSSEEARAYLLRYMK